MTDRYSEQILDYFLEELVSQQKPPDLSAQIESRWKQEKAASLKVPVQPANSTMVAAELVDSANVEIVALAKTPTKSIQRASVKLSRAKDTSLRRNFVAVTLAATACGLLIALIPRLTARIDRQTSPTAVSRDADHQHTDSGLAADNSDRNSIKLQNSSAEPRIIESLPLDNLPFALDVASDKPAIRSSIAPESVEQLAAQQITAQIDERLSNIWQGVGLVPTASLSGSQRAERVALLLTGSKPTESANKIDLESLVAEATASRAFARLWSEKFARIWFSRSSLATNDQRLQDLQLKAADRIRTGQQWNHIPLDFLGGDISNADDSSPSTTTSNFVSAFSGNGNHRLVTRIGTSFLDANLACVRCHDSNMGGPSHGSTVQFERQSVYWSLVAMLQGVDARTAEKGVRLAVDRQAEQLAAGKPLTTYFDLLDGRLQAADARLPDGQAWESIASAKVPRIALAQWLSESPALDNATVNQVWKIVFGQPLVPQVISAVDDAKFDVALSQRRDLQKFLADQFRAHGHDLRKLVGWIALSEAVAREPLDVTQTAWLNASDQELAKWQNTEAFFAAGAAPRMKETPSLENSLLAVLKRDNSTQIATLAQPNISSPASQIRSRVKNQASLAGLDHDHYLLLPNREELAYVESLLSSKRLSWEECVEHIVLMNPINVANGRVKYLAEELLRQHRGDAREALLDLFWAVKNSDAI